MENAQPQHNSHSKQKLGIALILLSAVFTSVGQLLWKIADGEINFPPPDRLCLLWSRSSYHDDCIPFRQA